MDAKEDWDKIYLEGKHNSVWPWSEVVSSVNRHAIGNFRHPLKVLELGCGAGANIPFFNTIDADYYGIDYSPKAVNDLNKKFPHLAGKIKSGDFCTEIPFNETFDIILDRGSITHNYTAAILRCFNLLKNISHPKTLILGLNWFSTNSSDYTLGEATEDPFCKTNFKSGNFVGTGVVHFATEKHLRELLSSFEFIELNYTETTNIMPKPNLKLAYWNFIVQRSPS